MSTTEATNNIRAFAEEILGDGVFGIDGAVSHHGMSVVPIVLTEEKLNHDYINAAMALERGTLVISEAGDAVETLIAQNTSDKPVLIEEAEVLSTGNSQDRIVVASVILQPGETTRIPVKCVHAPHGLVRGARYQSIGGGSVPMKSKLRTMKYQSIMTDVDHYIPETAVDQSEVWDEVERYCKAMGIRDTTKYTEAMDKIQKKSKEIADRFRGDLPKNTCGFIALDPDGNIVALEFYRNINAFRHRAGVFESLVVEYCDAQKESLRDEASREKVLNLLAQLTEIGSEEAIAKDGSDTIVIGFQGFKGEAVTGIAREGPRKMFYCSLSK